MGFGAIQEVEAAINLSGEGGEIPALRFAPQGFPVDLILSGRHYRWGNPDVIYSIWRGLVVVAFI
jgi:hypothetical protein